MDSRPATAPRAATAEIRSPQVATLTERRTPGARVRTPRRSTGRSTSRATRTALSSRATPCIICCRTTRVRVTKVSAGRQIC
jgi:hypothetical protein